MSFAIIGAHRQRTVACDRYRQPSVRAARADRPHRRRLRHRRLATPSENTVRFYLGRGFQPVADPLAELFELDAVDVHMRKMP